MANFDVLIIGSGPGGYVAAIRAAQLGFKVACVEKDKTLGGTCLNVGCIPSKALLHSSELYEEIKTEGQAHGIESSATLNFPVMQSRKDKVVANLTSGIDYLFKKNKITKISGIAELIGNGQVKVGSETHQAKFIILATGSTPIALPFLPLDEKRILSSTGALALKEVPKTLLVVGAGIIGLELGSVYRRLGSKVIVVEMLDHIAPTFDREVSNKLLPIFKKQGIEFHLQTRVKAGRAHSSGVELAVLDKDGKESTLVGDYALISIGRKPYHEGLGLEKVGVTLDGQKRVQVNANFETTAPGIYAIGDLIDGPMLAHKASEEGVVLVERLAGLDSHLNYLAIPNVMYTFPEVASVGLSSEEATSPVISGLFPFSANARARCIGHTDGFVKVIAEKESRRLLGVHIVGPSASEMIGSGAVAISKKMTIEEFAHVPAAHPTLSECLKEASLAALNRQIHL